MGGVNKKEECGSGMWVRRAYVEIMAVKLREWIDDFKPFEIIAEKTLIAGYKCVALEQGMSTNDEI